MEVTAGPAESNGSVMDAHRNFFQGAEAKRHGKRGARAYNGSLGTEPATPSGVRGRASGHGLGGLPLKLKGLKHFSRAEEDHQRHLECPQVSPASQA